MNQWSEFWKWKADLKRRETDHSKIIEILIKPDPALILRTGDGEARLVTQKGPPLLASRHIGVSPPNDEEINEFSVKYIEALRAADMICEMRAHWFPFEKNFLQSNANENASRVFAETVGDLELFLDPRTRNKSWFASLECRKILIVHSFADDMKRQYELGVFDYPKFESIEFFKAPNTQAEPTDSFTTTWSGELAKATERIARIDFEIALIGCGGYSSPIALFCKKTLKKKAVVIGGYLQLYFAISGKRWQEQAKDRGFSIDSKWIKPSEHNRPKNWKSIEGGAYW